MISLSLLNPKYFVAAIKKDNYKTVPKLNYQQFITLLFVSLFVYVYMYVISTCGCKSSNKKNPFIYAADINEACYVVLNIYYFFVFGKTLNKEQQKLEIIKVIESNLNNTPLSFSFTPQNNKPSFFRHKNFDKQKIAAGKKFTKNCNCC